MNVMDECGSTARVKVISAASWLRHVGGQAFELSVPGAERQWDSFSHLESDRRLRLHVDYIRTKDVGWQELEMSTFVAMRSIFLLGLDSLINEPECMLNAETG
jgi:hypothetical protein